MREPESLQISVQCVKARDFEFLNHFDIMGRPYIGDRGDFVLVDELYSERRDSEVQALSDFVRNNPHASYREIKRSIGIPTKRIREMAAAAGWKKEERRDGNASTPYLKLMLHCYLVPLLREGGTGTEDDQVSVGTGGNNATLWPATR